jgi:hypothetical protein
LYCIVPDDEVDAYPLTNNEGIVSPSPDFYNNLSSSSCSPNIDNDSATASQQEVEDDMASLESYLDDMIFREDPTSPHYGTV